MCEVCARYVVATGSSQALSDQKPAHHGSSSSLASSACSVQSGCTEKAVDNLSMKDSIFDGRYLMTLFGRLKPRVSAAFVLLQYSVSDHC